MRILMAPMQGVVDFHLRKILTRIGGIDGCVTEFIRVTEHRLPERVFYRYCPELKNNAKTYSQTPVKIQFLGSNPQALAANAQKAARLGATDIDLNFGCPAKIVNNNLGGARLLNDPELIFRIVSEVRQSLPESVSLSAKIRLGYEQRDRYLEAAHAVESGGASELVVHARSKADGYQPPAYWHLISEIQSKVAISVVSNGEIWTLDDWQKCCEQSQTHDVMLGRGLLAKPDLALIIKRHIQSDTRDPSVPAMNWQDACGLLFDYHQQTRDFYPKKYLGNRIKQWLAYLQIEFPEAGDFLQRIKRSRDDTFLCQQFALELNDPEHRQSDDCPTENPQSLPRVLAR